MKYKHSIKLTCIMRHSQKHTLTERNISFGNIAKNLGILYRTLSPEYIDDLGTYSRKSSQQHFRRRKLAMNANSFFTKLMYMLAKAYPDINLETITKQKILDAGYPVDTLQHAMESGFLRRVYVKHELDGRM